MWQMKSRSSKWLCWFFFRWNQSSILLKIFSPLNEFLNLPNMRIWSHNIRIYASWFPYELPCVDLIDLLSRMFYRMFRNDMVFHWFQKLKFQIKYMSSLNWFHRRIVVSPSMSPVWERKIRFFIKFYSSHNFITSSVILIVLLPENLYRKSVDFDD